MQRLTISDVQTFATDRGGKCLSKEYVNNSTTLEWMCAKGHTWDSPYSIVQQGGWCQQCLRVEQSKIQFEEILKIAKGHKIECLSKEYVGHKEKLQFKCSNGHIFLKRAKEFRDRPLCYTCYRSKDREKGLLKMQAIAKQNGGKLLSEFKTYHHAVKWECAEGHTWSSAPSNAEKGSWCPECTKSRVDDEQRKYSIDDLQKYAAKKGGLVLSEKYLNQMTPVKWKCENGHVWKATTITVIDGESWCEKCGETKLQTRLYDELKKIAKERQGRLISEKYIDNKSDLEWQCKRKHIWKADASAIKSGRWCRECSFIDSRLSIEEFEALAKEKGGKLLSKEYVNSETKLTIQCAKGHIWSAWPQGLKAGYWCRKCFGEGNRLKIEEIQKIAEERGGKLLSKEYINSSVPLTFQCSKGHIWSTNVNHVKKGTWCKICRREEAAEKRKYQISDLQKHAKEKGGKLLSKKYINSQTPIEWQCKEGHKWLARPGLVLNKGTWCPQCAIEYRKLDLAAMKKLAKEKGGKLISENYINNSTHLTWKCSKGHIWEAAPKGIINGQWCPECKADKTRLSIDAFHKIAKLRGGKLLSPVYVNSTTHLEWQCKSGHTWKAVPVEVKRGSWCPRCARGKSNS